MDYLLFISLSLAALCHLVMCAWRQKYPHWSAGITLAIAGIVCPLATVGILLIFFGALLLVL